MIGVPVNTCESVAKALGELLVTEIGIGRELRWPDVGFFTNGGNGLRVRRLRIGLSRKLLRYRAMRRQVRSVLRTLRQ